MSSQRQLVIFANVKAIPLQSGRMVLAGRLLSGMAAHAKHWDGDVVCACEPAAATELDGNLDRALGGDNVEVDPRELGFELVVTDFDTPLSRQVLSRATVAMVGIGHRTTHLSRWGTELGVPVVYGTEYSLKTRLQAARAEVKNPLHLVRRSLWEMMLERRQQRAIRTALGVQCNGTPTYEIYRTINPNTMLYFDGRMDSDMLATPAEQAQRHQRMRSGEPLRLAWSGRLNRMKGADQLPRFAAELKALFVPFSLKIFGGGVLEGAIRREVSARGLDDCVEVKGFVDFYEVLTPFLRREVDIWVCPHLQGDPSGAYMEAFGDGLPIVGYANEAFSGMLKMVSAGRSVRLSDPSALAQAVADAHRDRERLIGWSEAALDYSTQHTFDKTFERRTQHIDALLATRAHALG
jgi:glycosyltransferase involved in cell wall biosynthesis